MYMRRSALTLFSALAFVGAVHATDWLPATRGELKVETSARIEGDKANAAALATETKARKDADTQLGYEINTQAKYITSVNEDLQSSKAAGLAAYNQVQGQVGQLNDKIDQTRADGAAAIGQTNQAVKAVDDKVNTAIGVQTGINNQVQGQIGAVNGRVDATEHRLDGAEGAIRDVQGAAQTANDRASALEIRADGSESAIRETNGAVQSVNTDLQNSKAAQTAINGHLQTGINGAQNTANTALSNAGKAQASADQANAGLVKTNAVVSNHETRITNGEKVNARQDVTLNQHEVALQQNASQWQTQGRINNEYGQRLDNQDVMQSRFAADLGNVKAQYAGLAAEQQKQGKRIGQVENGLAGVAALAAIQFNTDPEAGFQVGCGVAQIRSNNGAACGAGGAITKNWFAAGYVMQASSSSGVAASATYSFGR